MANLKILCANGVNLDLLGRREPHLYGHKTLNDHEDMLRETLPALLRRFDDQASCTLEFFQTNDEAAFLHKLDGEWDGAILNPGAWTHTSLALGDRLAALGLCFVEVHLSQLAAREKVRSNNYISKYALGTIAGLGATSYPTALFALLEHLFRVNAGNRPVAEITPASTPV